MTYRLAPWLPWHLDTTAGTPDVSGLRRTRIVHDDGALYLDRYHLVDTTACQVRIHHWRSSDDGRAPHDHPWPNVTTVLAGHLLEHTTHSTTALAPGTVVVRQASEPHRVELVDDEAWTLFVTGAIERQWGFHTDQGWVDYRLWPHAGRYE